MNAEAVWSFLKEDTQIDSKKLHLAAEEYFKSMYARNTNNMFTLAYQWQDKQHRHVSDLCSLLKKAAILIQNQQRHIKKLEKKLETRVSKKSQRVQ